MTVDLNFFSHDSRQSSVVTKVKKQKSFHIKSHLRYCLDHASGGRLPQTTTATVMLI